MTQAAVELLAIKKFTQEFSSAILSSEISIVIQTASSARNQWLHGWVLHVVQSKSNSSICGFKMKSKKENWSSRRQGLISIHQMFSLGSASSSLEYLQGQFQRFQQQNKFSIYNRFSQSQHHWCRRWEYCQSSYSPSAVMMLKNNLVSDSDKLQGVLKGFSHLLVEGANIKEIHKQTHLLILDIKSFIVVQMIMKFRERE